MIASLTGSVQTVAPGLLIIGVGGIGFSVQVPGSLSANAQVGETITIFTSLVVREDSFSLFGFATSESLRLFDLLRSVSGVGPKTALSAISRVESADLAGAIANGDSSVFEAVPGIGAKTAKLIVVALAGKLKVNAVDATNIERNLLEALQSLGWSEQQARPALNAVLSRKDLESTDTAAIIKATLVLLAGKS